MQSINNKTNKMKNKLFQIVLLMGLAIAMFSCTPEDQCGTVTGWDIDQWGNYVVFLDGNKHKVIFSTWIEANVGDYFCISY